MSTTGFDLDTFLDNRPMDETSISGSELVGSDGSSSAFFREEGYEGDTDYRIRQLSYSSLITLHDCPRKFQLYKLRTTYREEERAKQTITFAYGHVVGEAIQLALEGKSESEIMFRMFLAWDTDLMAENTRESKSFWSAVLALKKFLAMREAGFLKEYELIYYNDKPACELSFVINLPDGFRYRGFVDAVLRHIRTGEIVVLECKTTKSKILDPVKFKNSAQALGYSIVLDSLFPELSSYKVLYLVYSTSEKEFTTFPFTKTYLQRALWIRELLLDIDIIKMFEGVNVYPMHGESCVTFATETEKGTNVWEGECEYINSCTMSTELITKKATPLDEDKTEYQVSLSLADLLETQLSKLGTTGE